MQSTAPITLDQLNSIFAGKTVRITHRDNRFLDRLNVTGRLTRFVGMRPKNQFAAEMVDSPRFFFRPTEITETYVEGPVGICAGIRRFEIVSET